MRVIDGILPSRPRGGFVRASLGIGSAGLLACLLAGCTSSGGDSRPRSSSPSVVYEHERFGSPEIRTPQLNAR